MRLTIRTSIEEWRSIAAARRGEIMI